MPAILIGDAPTGVRTARPVAPQIRVATASRTMPKPIVPMSIRSRSRCSSGRSTRSITRPMAAVRAIAISTARANGSLLDMKAVAAMNAPIMTMSPCAKLTSPMVR